MSVYHPPCCPGCTGGAGIEQLLEIFRRGELVFACEPYIPGRDSISQAPGLLEEPDYCSDCGAEIVGAHGQCRFDDPAEPIGEDEESE